jgi:hypothetical protein
MRQATVAVVARLALALTALTSVSRADQVHYRFDLGGVSSPVVPPGGSFPYEVYYEIEDVELDGYDSQGAGSLAASIFTNTGVRQPRPDFSPTSENDPSVTILDPVWAGAGTAQFVGGWGFGFVVDRGTQGGDDILDVGAFGSVVWDADVDNNPANGLNPYMLHGVGIGSPPGIDVGGHEVPSEMMGARDHWYVFYGQIAAPDTPGTYTVEVRPATLRLIRPDRDLHMDVTSGYGMSADWGIFFGETFAFTVTPEPAIGSALLLFAAAAVRRRMPLRPH